MSDQIKVRHKKGGPKVLHVTKGPVTFDFSGKGPFTILREQYPLVFEYMEIIEEPIKTTLPDPVKPEKKEEKKEDKGGK